MDMGEEDFRKYWTRAWTLSLLTPSCSQLVLGFRIVGELWEEDLLWWGQAEGARPDHKALHARSPSSSALLHEPHYTIRAFCSRINTPIIMLFCLLAHLFHVCLSPEEGSSCHSSFASWFHVFLVPIIIKTDYISSLSTLLWFFLSNI